MKTHRRSLLVALTLGSLLLIICRPETALDLSVFGKPETEEAAMDYYREKLAHWPVAYDTLHIPTRYGTTFVITCGPADGKPVVLMHGHHFNSTIWLDQIGPLCEKYRVYAIDAIGDLGKSRLRDIAVYPRTGEDIAVWLEEILNVLSIERAALIGVSLGGWRAVQCAIHLPRRIEKIVGIVPFGFNSLTGTMLRVNREFSSQPKETALNILFEAMGADSAFIGKYGGHYRATFEKSFPRTPSVARFTPDELRRVSVPALFLFGGEDVFIGNAQRASRRAEMFVKHGTAQVYPEGRHILQVQMAREVNRCILKFLREP